MILSMFAHVKANALSLVATVVSGAAAIAAWQAQLEWGLKICASLVAITAGALSIYDWWKKRRR